MSKLGYSSPFPLFITVCAHTHTHAQSLLHLCELWSSARSGHFPRNNSLFSSPRAQSASLWVTAPRRAHCVCVHKRAHTNAARERQQSRMLHLFSHYSLAGLLLNSFTCCSISACSLSVFSTVRIKKKQEVDIPKEWKGRWDKEKKKKSEVIMNENPAENEFDM